MDQALQQFWNQQWQRMSAGWIYASPDHDLRCWIQAQPQRYMRVLEIGCGQGHNAAWLHDQGHDVVAIDISDYAIAQCRAAWPQIDFRHCDILAADVDLGRFDLVFERGVMVVLNRARDRRALVAAAARHLAPGGHYVSVVDCTEQRRVHDPALSHRSLGDIADAIQPYLDIESIHSTLMPVPAGHIPAWFVVSSAKPT